MGDMLGGVGLPKGYKKVSKNESLGPKARKSKVRENKLRERASHKSSQKNKRIFRRVLRRLI
jgi:hypothetical protein